MVLKFTVNAESNANLLLFDEIISPFKSLNTIKLALIREPWFSNALAIVPLSREATACLKPKSAVNTFDAVSSNSSLAFKYSIKTFSAAIIFCSIC